MRASGRTSAARLLWDVFAVSTYFTVSVLFWYTGLVPDLATLRDRATSRVKKFFFTVFALGWRGSNRNWRHYEMAYLILAGISTPLCSPCIRSCRLTSPRRSSPAGTPRSSRPTLSRARSSADRDGADHPHTRAHPLPAAQGPDYPGAHRPHVARSSCSRAPSSVYAYAMEFFIAWYGGNPYEQWLFLRNRLADPLIFTKILHWAPVPGAVLVGLLVHDYLQRARAAVLLVEEEPLQPLGRVINRQSRERGHVGSSDSSSSLDLARQ